MGTCPVCHGPLPPKRPGNPAPITCSRSCAATRAVMARINHWTDRPPELTAYADKGCDSHPSCLRCPLPRCKFEAADLIEESAILSA